MVNLKLSKYRKRGKSLLFCAALAAGNGAWAGDGEELERLMGTLDEVSALATKSRLNIDDTPAIMSVLRGDDLERYGVATLHEALTLLPGIEGTMNTVGLKKLIVRGVFTLNRDKVKVMVDGVTVTNAFYGEAGFMDFPVGLIRRIEVIRGPGSALYGADAYVAVINVVTRSGEGWGSHWFTGYGSFTQGIAGGNGRWNAGGWKVAADLFFATSDKELESGKDILGGTPLEPLSNAPGKTNERREQTGAGLILSRGETTLKLRTHLYRLGSHYGFGYLLEGDGGLRTQIATFTGEAAWKRELNKDLQLTVTGGYRRFAFDGDYVMASAGFPLTVPGMGTVSAQYHVWQRPHIVEEDVYGEGTAAYTGLENHRIVAGAYLETKDAVETSHENNYPGLTPNETRYEGEQAFIRGGSHRTITAVYLQDSWKFREATEFSFGARLDHYSDFGSSFNPRAALVHRMENANVKLLYQRAFRPPSWVELYALPNDLVSGNDRLKAETIDTLEAGYVYKAGGGDLLRANLFYFRQYDLIEQGTDNKYRNMGDEDSHGLELEGRYHPLREFRITANYSYVNGHGDDADPYGYAAHQFKGILDYNPARNLNLATLFRIIGSRAREEEDPREALDGYAALDQSATWRSDGGLSLTLTGKNLTGADVRYPAPAGSYAGDYRREGRTLLLALSGSF